MADISNTCLCLNSLFVNAYISMFKYLVLVGGLEHLDYLSIQLGQLGLIIPTDELHHFSEG